MTDPEELFAAALDMEADAPQEIQRAVRKILEEDGEQVLSAFQSQVLE